MFCVWCLLRLFEHRYFTKASWNTYWNSPLLSDYFLYVCTYVYYLYYPVTSFPFCITWFYLSLHSFVVFEIEFNKNFSQVLCDWMRSSFRAYPQQHLLFSTASNSTLLAFLYAYSNRQSSMSFLTSIFVCYHCHAFIHLSYFTTTILLYLVSVFVCLVINSPGILVASKLSLWSVTTLRFMSWL